MEPRMCPNRADGSLCDFKLSGEKPCDTKCSWVKSIVELEDSSMELECAVDVFIASVKELGEDTWKKEDQTMKI